MNLDDIFKQDQNDESTRRMVRTFSTYYDTLIKEGVPPELAADLLSDYHWLFMCSVIFKDGNFPPRS